MIEVRVRNELLLKLSSNVAVINVFIGKIGGKAFNAHQRTPNERNGQTHWLVWLIKWLVELEFLAKEAQ